MRAKRAGTERQVNGGEVNERRMQNGGRQQRQQAESAGGERQAEAVQRQADPASGNAETVPRQKRTGRQNGKAR